MRRFVVVLMLLLLPLRAVMGDAMAMETASASHVMPCHDEVTAAMAGMDMNMPAHGHAKDDCHQCLSCQVCHSAAVVFQVPHAPLAAPQFAAPRSLGASMTEAPSLARFKPPIS